MRGLEDFPSSDKVATNAKALHSLHPTGHSFAKAGKEVSVSSACRERKACYPLQWNALFSTFFVSFLTCDYRTWDPDIISSLEAPLSPGQTLLETVDLLHILNLQELAPICRICALAFRSAFAAKKQKHWTQPTHLERLQFLCCFWRKSEPCPNFAPPRPCFACPPSEAVGRRKPANSLRGLKNAAEPA